MYLHQVWLTILFHVRAYFFIGRRRISLSGIRKKTAEVYFFFITNDRVTGCDLYSDRYLGSISEGNLVGPALKPKVTVLDLHAQSPIKERIRAANGAMRAV